MKFLRGLLAFFFLGFLAIHPAWAKGQVVWIALSSEGDAYSEAAAALVEGLTGEEVLVRPWRDLVSRASPEPDVIVTLGSEALSRFAETAEVWPGTPIVALLVPRSGLDQTRELGAKRVTGIYLDQPFDRQLRLIKLALPGRDRVGVVLGPDSKAYLKEIRKAARQAGLELVVSTVESREQVSPALQTVFAVSDSLLSVPDSVVFSRHMAQYVLIASYRNRMPMLGYSAPLVRAGALAAVVATPAEIGAQGAALVARLLAGGALPAPKPPEAYRVTINDSVARALSLPLNEVELDRKLRTGRVNP